MISEEFKVVRAHNKLKIQLIGLIKNLKNRVETT
jgi:hypothetical protein